MLSIDKRRKYRTISHNNPVYASWRNMMNCCYDKGSKNYNRYGARGIDVHKRWHNFDLFANDMQKSYFTKSTLERIDNELGYSIHNCKWATRQEQAENRSSSNRIKDPTDGKIYTLTALAKKYGISRNTVTSRIRLGYVSFESLTQPSVGRGRASFSKEFIR